MSRIPAITDARADAGLTETFAAIKAKVGMVPNLYRVAANQPATLGGLLGLTDTLGNGAFTPREREAIALTVAAENGCEYCASAHSAISGMLKVSEDEIAQHLSGTSDNPRLRAILRLASAITTARGQVPDAVLADARGAGLSDADIVETVANVAANIFTNYLNNVAQTDIDFPLRRL